MSDSGEHNYTKFPYHEPVEETKKQVDKIQRHVDKIARESDSEAKDDKFDIQNKGSFKKDSPYFLYTLDQDRSIKKTAEKFLKNRQAKTQLFNMFTKLDREKSILKGKKIIAFKPLKK